MTVRINKQKINLREKLAGAEDKVNFDEVVRGLGEYGGNVGIGTTSPGYKLHMAGGTPAMKLEGSQPRIWLSENDQSDLNSLIRNNGSIFQIDTVADNDDFIANRFSINHSNGNVGIGTTSPDARLEVKSGVNALPQSDISADTGTALRILGNDAAAIDFGSTGRTNNGGVGQWIQARHSEVDSTYYSLLLNPLGGNVGIGTTSPISSAKLEVQGDSNGAAGIGIRHTGATAGNLWRMYMRNDSDLVISSPVSVGVQLGYGQTSWSAESDESLKDNISELGLVLDKVKNYRCINYSLISNEMTEANAVGFIAQDWESDFPNIVSSDEDGKLSMKYTETIPVLLKAIQEQQQIIDQLKSRIETLEQQ